MSHWVLTGKRCEPNENECVSNPCRNEAVCVDGAGKFTCTCRPGFTGRPNLLSAPLLRTAISCCIYANNKCMHI